METDELITATEILNLVNHDCHRLLLTLKEGEDRGEVGVIDGPKMCLKTTKLEFKTSYRAAIEQMKGMAGGPRVKSVEFRVLQDADKNYWGDFGMFKISVQ